MNLLDVFATTPWLFLLAAGLLGLLVGSFLNVVILRLPQMMHREWAQQCAELAGKTVQAQEPFNLQQPPSHCPQCGAPVRAWQNIPIISYLLLRGRCASCGKPIPLRYPVVEAVTGILTVVVAWHFGPTPQALAAMLLTWALIGLSVIDLDHHLLPDQITLPVTWLGLLLSLLPVFASPSDAILGAVVGYLSLWLVFQAFRLLTGKEGMGFGDFKLLALFGAWLGWQMLPQIILIASLCGALVGIALILFRQHQRGTPIPFGPYLAVAGWIALLWGPQINQAYLTFAGLA